MFPWEHLLGQNILTRKGLVATDNATRGKNTIGLYFTASWCRPCQEFTPILATMYRNMCLKKYKDLHMDEQTEIVMVSLDRDEQSFKDYVMQTPFAALPYERRDLVKELWDKYQVKTIPSLVFVNQEGEVVEREGRKFVENNFLDLKTIWNHLQQKSAQVP